MKRLIWSAFVAFWSSVGTIVAVGALSPTPVAAIGSEPQVTREVSLDELAQHNTEADCWIAIRGKVYDFSTYIPEHPAPPVVLPRAAARTVPWQTPCWRVILLASRFDGHAGRLP